jgi:hypothetical protein
VHRNENARRTGEGEGAADPYERRIPRGNSGEDTLRISGHVKRRRMPEDRVRSSSDTRAEHCDT